jgi:DNA (cytosine-5)-methyltransferase 1
LAEMGMDAIWGVFSACATGAPHTRERLFILAYPDSGRSQSGIQQSHRGAKSSKQGTQSIRPRRATTDSIRISSEVWRAGHDDILRMADGDTDRGHRIKALGNGQVPVVVATAWHTLSREIGR